MFNASAGELNLFVPLITIKYLKEGINKEACANSLSFIKIMQMVPLDRTDFCLQIENGKTSLGHHVVIFCPRSGGKLKRL